MSDVIVQLPQQIAGVASGSGRLRAGFHTPVDASKGPTIMTLPDVDPNNAGARLSAEKMDSSSEAVQIQGSIRGAQATVTLVFSHQTVEFCADSSGSWWPTANYIGADLLQSTFVPLEHADIDVTMFGAVGDGKTDNTAALNAAFSAAASAKRIAYVPRGDYAISGPLKFVCSIRGAGREASRVFATGSWSKLQMIDFYLPDQGKFIEDLTLDAQLKPKLQILGSSYNAQGSAAGHYRRISFQNTAPGVYAVGGSSTVSAPGMLTGAVFERCDWNNCAQWVQAGTNQDDIIFIGCRFTAEPANVGTTFALDLGGNNITFDTTYIAVSPIRYAVSAVAALVRIGSGIVQFRSTFIESLSGTKPNYTHLFWATDPNYTLAISGLRLNYLSGSLRAIVRCAVQKTNGPRTSVDVRFVHIEGGTPSSFAIADVYVGSGSKPRMTTLTFNAADAVGRILMFGAASIPSPYPSVFVDGIWRGTRRSGRASVAGGPTHLH